MNKVPGLILLIGFLFSAASAPSFAQSKTTAECYVYWRAEGMERIHMCDLGMLRTDNAFNAMSASITAGAFLREAICRIHIQRIWNKETAFALATDGTGISRVNLSEILGGEWILGTGIDYHAPVEFAWDADENMAPANFGGRARFVCTEYAWIPWFGNITTFTVHDVSTRWK